MGRLPTAAEDAAWNSITGCEDFDEFSRLVNRQTIDFTVEDLPAVSGQAWNAIREANEPPTLFRYGGIASRIEAGDSGEPVLRDLTFDRMRYHLARAARFTKQKRSGEDFVEKEIVPPKDVVNDVLATPDVPLPVLTRIVEAPVFAADGSLKTTPGYNPASQTYYAPAKGFSVPDVSKRPTSEDLENARNLIVDELLSDFPFVQAEQPTNGSPIASAELAHAVALLLLPFARDLIDGPTPLHLIEKPSPGTGATLLCDVLAFPATGRPMGIMTEARDEDEWRKRITAQLRGSPAHINIDNLRRRLDSAAVSAAITSRAWEDRILGGSLIAKTPVRCGWVATGNNPGLSTEITRRTVRIRLNAKQDRPWLRTGFRHADLRGWAIKNRGLLVWAALTLIQTWISKGMPLGTTKIGMFEAWSEVMGGILETTGIHGLLTNLEDFYSESDTEGATWRTFLLAWWEAHRTNQVVVKDLFSIGIEAGLAMGDGSEQSQKVKLGNMLGDRRDRVFDMEFDGQKVALVVQKGGKYQKATLWNLQNMD